MGRKVGGLDIGAKPGARARGTCACDHVIGRQAGGLAALSHHPPVYKREAFDPECVLNHATLALPSMGLSSSSSP